MLDLLVGDLPRPARGVFTTRAGGSSPAPWDGLDLALHTGDDPDRVQANRDLLAHELGLPSADRLVLGRQVHGAGVCLVSGPAGGAVGLAATDGLVTSVPGLALMMLGADCLPVLLADPAAGVVGAAHVGRLGLTAGILLEVLKVMAGVGGRPERTAAVLGPGVCGSCYEVPEQMAADAEAAAPGSRGATRTGGVSIDLAAGARRQLERAGLLAVHATGGCTMEQPERFFSYRRDGVTGRHGGVVWLG